MEKREAKIIFNKAGGTASKSAFTNKLSIPTKWIKEMGLSPEERDVELIFENNKITIKKK
jgi:hypothetical protein